MHFQTRAFSHTEICVSFNTLHWNWPCSSASQLSVVVFVLKGGVECCSGDCVAHRAENVYHRALYRKSLLIPDLDWTLSQSLLYQEKTSKLYVFVNEWVWVYVLQIFCFQTRKNLSHQWLQSWVHLNMIGLLFNILKCLRYPSYRVRSFNMLVCSLTF